MSASEKNIERIFRQYYRQLCIFALHYVKKAFAEDVVQEAFISLWERMDEVRDPRAYLFISVRNRCISLANKPETACEALPADIPEEDLENRSELEARIWKAIDDLPERRREVFLMSKRDGLKYEDIAYRLGISVNTVRNHISKALAAIREVPQRIMLFFLNLA